MAGRKIDSYQSYAAFAKHYNRHLSKKWDYYNGSRIRKQKASMSPTTTKSAATDAFQNILKDTMEVASHILAPENGTYVNEDQTRIEYYKNGLVHRDEDEPAIVSVTGEEVYAQNGFIHRDARKGPAVIIRDKNGRDTGYLFVENGKLLYSAETDKKGNVICMNADRKHHNPHGPAVITDRMKSWYLNGQLHRVDGPAIMYSNGDEVWYLNGQIHRDGDLPAIIKKEGVKKWYQHGKLCRLSGAANVIQHDGTQYWYSNEDTIHRDNDLPAIIYTNGKKEWLQNNKNHRDGDLPAIVAPGGFRKYYKHGLLHRENGPAVVIPEEKTVAYYQNGELHREGNKPALEQGIKGDKNRKLVYAEHGKKYATGAYDSYYEGFAIHDEDGELHSPEPSQPALEGEDGSEYWYKHGEFHRDGDLPAVMNANGTRAWYKDGHRHRDGDKPALIERTERSWYKHGKRHRDGDLPAVQNDNGSEAYYVDDLLHRDGDKPALYHPGKQTGWYQHGDLHRDGDKPALIMGTQHSYYKHGKLHRDGNKPAVEDPRTGEFAYSRNGKYHRVVGPAVYEPKTRTMEYWIDGVRV